MPRIASEARLVLALALVAPALVAGCGCSGRGGDASTDASPSSSEAGGDDAGESGIPFPEAGAYDAWTPAPDVGDGGTSLFGAGPGDFGPALLIDTLAFAPMGVGQDLDGDATPDNELATIPFGLDGLNDVLATGISDGSLALVYEIRGLEDIMLGAPDDTIDVPFYNTVSTPTTGEYLIVRDSLTAAGEPNAIFYDASIGAAADPGGPVLDARANGLGGVALGFPFINAHLTALAVPATGPPRIEALESGLLGGVVSACALANSPDPFFGAENLLNLLVGVGIAPDIDLSGDGLETFDIAPGLPAQIESCIDGDGTVIPELPGRPCACDERIEDGMSLALTFHATLVEIVGVQP